MAPRLEPKEAALTPLRPNWPAGLPSPEALQAATDALHKYYVMPETLLHPVVVEQAIEMAYLLSAYGLTPADPHIVEVQPGLIRGATRRPPRNRERLGQRAQIVYDGGVTMEPVST
jgi:hypothetical protein